MSFLTRSRLLVIQMARVRRRLLPRLLPQIRHYQLLRPRITSGARSTASPCFTRVHDVLPPERPSNTVAASHLAERLAEHLRRNRYVALLQPAAQRFDLGQHVIVCAEMRRHPIVLFVPALCGGGRRGGLRPSRRRSGASRGSSARHVAHLLRRTPRTFSCARKARA